MPIPNIIAIDGPAASGKSTLGKNLADYLKYLYFDTGIMYRAVTWAALNRGIAIENKAEISALAENIDIDVRAPKNQDGRTADVLVDGQDVTWEIRSPEVDANVSAVSAYPRVRRALSAQQRRIGLRGHVVMVGRDIGTVVLPEADLKIYLDASVEERARRRFAEIQKRDDLVNWKRRPVTLNDILKAMRKRDEIDSTRQMSPLRPAEDAIVLVSDQLDASQVLERVKEIIEVSSVQS